MRFQSIKVTLLALRTVLAGAILLLGTSSATFGQLPAVRSSCLSEQLTTFHFVTPKMGWALGSCSRHPAVLRTTDGGNLWRKLTVPPIRRIIPPRPFATVFLDSTHAWLAGTENRQQDGVVRTNDGGNTWHLSLVNATVLPNYVPYFAALTFLNRRTGWLDTMDAGMHQRIARLHLTHDNGLHWTPIAANLPISQILGFQSSTIGFGADIEGGGGPNVVYRSLDSGRHWQPSRLPIPSIYRHVRVSVNFASLQAGDTRGNSSCDSCTS